MHVVMGAFGCGLPRVKLVAFEIQGRIHKFKKFSISSKISSHSVLSSRADDEEDDAAAGDAEVQESATDAESKDTAVENGDSAQLNEDERGAEDDDSNGDGEGAEEDGEEEVVEEVAVPVKKKPEPYEVPKSGHFYLHDDRTEVKDKTEGEDDQQATRPRKKLWSDEPKWKHDKYVEVRATR